MNIVACIKQVPDTNEVRIDSKTNNLVILCKHGVKLVLRLYDKVIGIVQNIIYCPVAPALSSDGEFCFFVRVRALIQ